MSAFPTINRTCRVVSIAASSMCCLAASTCVASAGIITFENLPPTSDSTARGQQIFAAVDGFAFTSSNETDSANNWYYYNVPNAHLDNDSRAFGIGARGTTAIYGGNYSSSSNHYNTTYNISRSDGSRWKFDQAVFTSVWAMGTIQLIGLRNGVEVFYYTQNISNVQQTMVNGNGWTSNWIDTLKIRNFVGDVGSAKDFIMDDMYYTLPAPGVLAMIGIAGYGSCRRRCRR